MTAVYIPRDATATAQYDALSPERQEDATPVAVVGALLDFPFFRVHNLLVNFLNGL